MNRPAIVMPLLSHVAAVPASVKTPSLVRYVVKTKVVATALKAALPQSQAAQSTTLRVMTRRWVAGVVLMESGSFARECSVALVRPGRNYHVSRRTPSSGRSGDEAVDTSRGTPGCAGGRECGGQSHRRPP